MSGEVILSAENSEKKIWAVRAPPRTPLGSSQRSPRPVMWSETSVLEQDRSETKKIGLVLVPALQLYGIVLKKIKPDKQTNLSPRDVTVPFHYLSPWLVTAANVQH